MKIYKRFLCLLPVLALTALAGCGGQPSASPDDLPSPGEQVSPSGGEYSPDPNNTFYHSEPFDENGFWSGVRALDYAGNVIDAAVSAPSDVLVVSDSDFQNGIEDIISYYSYPQQNFEREVEFGDSINIDYVGTVDGVEFERGSTDGMGATVVVGETPYIDNFLEQLIGHKPGDTVNVEVTFPMDYGQPHLDGRDALFVTVINYIEDPVMPELTDEFVSEFLYDSYSWTTVAEMEERVRSDLQKSALQKYLGTLQVTSVPDRIIVYMEEAMINEYQEVAMYYGMELAELLSYEGISSVEELIALHRESNMERAVFYLVSQAIAEHAGISVTEADLSSYFATYAGIDDYTALIDQYGLPYLTQFVLCQKALEYILANS